MENKKTIEHLNTKAWYRFVKVIFIILFVFVFTGYNFAIFSSGVSKVDNKNTTIQCNIKDKQTFTAEDLNLSFTKNYFPNDSFDYKKFFGGFNDYTIKAILTACNPKVFTGSKIDDIYDIQKGYEILDKAGVLSIEDKTERETEINAVMTRDYLPYKNQTSNLYGNSKIAYLDFSFKIFDIKPSFTNTEFMKYFFIGNIVILLILFLARGIFYYIVLGKFDPNGQIKKIITENK